MSEDTNQRVELLRLPSVRGIKETCLYVEDIARARQFYEGILRLDCIAADERFCALNVAQTEVLLLFKRGTTSSAMPTPGGIIPAHDSAGPAHIGFAIASSEFEVWRASLTREGVAIESVVQWPRGGQSLYFRDPDHHLVELLTPGVWSVY